MKTNCLAVFGDVYGADEVYSGFVHNEIGYVLDACCPLLAALSSNEPKLSFAVEIRIYDKEPESPGILYEATVGTKEFRPKGRHKAEKISYTHYDTSELWLPDINMEEIYVAITAIVQRKLGQKGQINLDSRLADFTKKLKTSLNAVE